jgi:DNA polymerase I-like protein with 3'-5' exonuclease and polymerase domains
MEVACLADDQKFFDFASSKLKISVEIDLQSIAFEKANLPQSNSKRRSKHSSVSSSVLLGSGLDTPGKQF